MSDFEERLNQTIKNKVVSEIKNTRILANYNFGQQLPNNFVEKLWAEIDWDEVLATVGAEVQRRVCNSIIGSMETEIKTDVKKLMAVEGVREKLRMEVYPHLMKALNESET